VKSLGDQITAELQVLVEQPIGDCWRAADMAIFEFGPRRQMVNRYGQEVETSDISLHLQCRWRFVGERGVVFGSDDLYLPADPDMPADEFDWDKHDSVLDVLRRGWFEQRRGSLPVVEEVVGDDYGGFRVLIFGGFALECLPCDSRRHKERWRMLGHRDDGEHLVVRGDGVE
jgi:hypothetical protein